MSIGRLSIATALALVLAPGYARAQDADDQPRDRFFANKLTAEADSGTPVQVRLTSSTFFAQELGDSIFNGAQQVADNASPLTRLYTELRAQIAAGSNDVDSWRVHADARGRFNLPCTFQTRTDNPGAIMVHPELDECRTQSGTFGGNEYEIRELYGRRAGNTLTLQAGRQYVAEIAATKVDGVKAQYTLDANWSLIGFAGLAPSRISRSLVDDYAGGVLPIAAGAAGAYRYGGYFGSVGLAGIVPISTQNADADIQPRTFLTSNGYWRPTDLLDVYHFVSVDVSGPSTDEASDMFTNVSLGLNARPTDDLRLTAALHHFSTDTLEEFALQRREQGAGAGIIQNNVEVLRLTAQSARLGASMALLEKRFEVSTTFAMRHRPPETVCPSDDLDCAAAMGQTTRDAWSGEATLGVVDRRSIGGLRLGASVTNMFGLYDTLGLGEDSYGRSNWLVARIDASRELMNEQMQIDADVSYLHAEDVGDAGCTAALDCYGRTLVNTVSAGATLYYRFSPDWFALVMANVAMQSFAPDGITEPAAVAYTNTLLNGFLRLAYRF
jgi:hypothetical protein